MIITKELKIKTTNKNISYYKNLGFNIKSGDEIIIKPEQLPSNSRILITVECQFCNKINDISYYSYLRNIKNYNYYGCNKCSFEKGKRTNMLIYGKDHAMQNSIILKKTEETNLKLYGVKYPSQNNKIKKKIEDTTFKNYGVKSYLQTNESRLKWKENFDKNKEKIQNKREETNIEKYGVKTPLKSNEIKNKIKNTKKEKYNNSNYNNRDQYKKTCIKKFGFENPMQDEEIKEKVRNSVFERFGVYYASQNLESFDKMMMNGLKIKKYKELYYQGTYELDFLKKYYDIGIKKGKIIKYLYKENEHIYFPDYYYEKLNLIIEIKSSKWYKEHLEKNLIKKQSCIEQGYNFIFIIDKNYDIFNKLIQYAIYDKDHCWQYDIRLKKLEDDLKYIKIDKELKISDFKFYYVDSNDKVRCKEIKEFIEKYEWLGKMPNRPTHRFIATYNDILSGVIVMATPNQFSKILGEDTDKIEKLISRGACASWTPKNLASSLLMWSINWMVKNTEFRMFSAYSDPEAKELGTIYQACNFYYLGQKFGSTKLYFDLNNPHIGWTSNRTFRKRMSYKRYAKELNIEWQKNWSNNTRMLWENVPSEIELKLKEKGNEYIKNCLIRENKPKHKYIYLLGKDKRETKKLRNLFLEKNKIYSYPKNR